MSCLMRRSSPVEATMLIVMLMWTIPTVGCKKQEKEQPGEPSLDVSPAKLVFIADGGGASPETQVIEIRNAGAGTLEWSAACDVDWLTLSPVSGRVTTEAATIEVTPDTTGLPVGRHAAAVTLSDGVSTRKVHVAFFVMPGAGVTPVFVSFASHNEDDDRYDMYETESGYEGMRQAVLDMIGVAQAHDIPFDFQCDWRFLEAISRWETPALEETTNGKNLLRYLAEDLGVSVDPHSHECATASSAAIASHPEYDGGCSYADVAYLISRLGVTPSSVVGGFLVEPPQGAHWEDYRSVVPGVVYPTYTWRADVLWGGGSPQHTSDPQLSGVWRPSSHESYAVDNPTQSLPTIGNGGGPLQTLVQEIEDGQAPEGKIYTLTNMYFELEVYTMGDAYLDMFEEQILQLQPLVDQGKVIYATLLEVLEIWRTVYGSEPNVYDRSIPSVDVASQVLTVTNPTSGVSWWAKAIYPADASATTRYPAIISVPGGSAPGSLSESIADPDLNPANQAARGYVVVIFDADGRGNTPGMEDYCGHTHQDGLKALVDAVAALPYVDVTRIGISTGSYGITMGSGVLARYPSLPVRFLLDVEGPADRNDTGHCDASNTGHITHDCADDVWWAEREAATFATLVQVPYLRLQHVQDHAQPDNLHCILMVDSATAVAHGGQGVSSWTRVNGAAENAVNQTYTEVSPPVYTVNLVSFDLPAYWEEMFAL